VCVLTAWWMSLEVVLLTSCSFRVAFRNPLRTVFAREDREVIQARINQSQLPLENRVKVGVRERERTCGRRRRRGRWWRKPVTAVVKGAERVSPQQHE
jgi:hypothetical protein